MFNTLSFISYAVTTAITPGPNNISSMTNASRVGLRRFLPFNLGILCGFSIVMVLCTVFCTVLSELIPKIKLPMLVLGSLYMLYLAYVTFRSGRDGNGIEEKNSGSSFLSGFALQFVNPKIYIYGCMSLEAYIIPAFSGRWGILLLFALLLAFLGFVCTLLWAFFGSAFRVLFSKYARVTNTVMALLLVYCAVSLFF